MYRTKFFAIMVFVLSFFVKAQNEKNVLFVGNSITYFNNMPQTFKAIADDKGNPVNIEQHTPGGTGFVHHEVNENVYEKFRQGNWDYVVLQPGSSESVGASYTKEQTLLRAKKLNDSIKKYNPCAKVLYYEISYGVWGNTPENVVTYNNTMDIIKTNVTYWTDNTNAFFAPAGEAMKTAWNSDTDTLLWGSTGDIHPNAKGSYLIACTMYASIFQDESLGANVVPSGLTADEVAYYQGVADNTVLNNLSDWRINTYNQHSAFSYQLNENSVEFTNESVNSDTYLWDFGDGTTSTEENPIHQYAENGTYEVKLTTYREDCQEEVKKQILFNLSTEDIDDIAYSIYPNPFKNKIIIEGVNVIDSFKMYNVVGQRIEANLSKVDENKYQILTSGLSKGIYFIEMNGKVEKMMKISD